MDGQSSDVKRDYVAWLAQRMAAHDACEELKRGVIVAMYELFAMHCPVLAGDVVLVERRWFRLAKPKNVYAHITSGLPQFEWTADAVNGDGTVPDGFVEVGTIRLTFSPVRNPKTGQYEYEVVRRPRQDEPIEQAA